MSKRAKGPDGITRIFPDDATDEEMAAVIDAAQPAKKEPAIGANLHQEAKIGADPAPGGSDFKFLGIPIHVPGQRQRVDDNIADVGGVGIPPETVLMGPLQAGRAMMNPALSMAGKAAAAGGTMLSHALPVVKYEAAKHALTAIGVPSTIATAAAIGISGYKRGPGKTGAPVKAGPATEAAAETAPSVEAVAKHAPFNPTPAMQSARTAFKDAGLEPLPAEASNAMELIRRGKSPEEAVSIVVRNRPGAKEVAAVAEKVVGKLTAEEVKLGQSLMARGKTYEEALGAIKAQRAFSTIPGVQSSAEARAALDARNVTGQIKTPSAETARARRTP